LVLPATHQRFVERRASYSLELVEVELPSCNKIKLRHSPKMDYSDKIPLVPAIHPIPSK
jgi:ribosomal protein L32